MVSRAREKCCRYALRELDVALSVGELEKRKNGELPSSRDFDGDEEELPGAVTYSFCSNQETERFYVWRAAHY